MLRFCLILLCMTAPVKLQDIESSGEVAFPTEAEVITSSGEGPILIAADDVTDNVTSVLFGLDSNNTIPITEPSEELLTTTTTEKATTTTTEPTTITTTTTQAPTTTTTTTTEPPTTTTTRPTTTVEVTTTTPKPIRTTTKRVTTTTTTTKKPTTTTMITIHPLSSSTEDPNFEAKQCSFVEEDFSCNVEVTCFGEGLIDCDAFEEELPKTTASKLPSSSESYSDEDEDVELTTIGFFPPELVGRISQDKSLWKIQSLSTEDLSTSSTVPPTTPPSFTTTSTVVPETSSTGRPSTITTELVTNATSLTPETTTTELITTSVEENSTMNGTQMELQTANVTTASNDTEDGDDNNNSTRIPITYLTTDYTDYVVTDESTTEVPTTTTTTTEATTTTTPPTTTTSTTVRTTRRRLGRRYKRSKDQSSSSSLSSSLHISALEEPRKNPLTRYCRIVGNLKCTPAPTAAICKGRSACRVLASAGEKSEKSTSAKGVETWAIAVIAICAVAAAFTISLLVYLVVTSWKKLKVQPQNGVTTLTYVNSSQP